MINQKITGLWRWLLFLLCMGFFVGTHAQEEKPAQKSCVSCDLTDCLICPQLFEESTYARGVLKSLKYITPGKDNWLFRSDIDFNKELHIPEAHLNNFSGMIEALKQTGISLVIMVQPTRGLMHSDKILSEHDFDFSFNESKSSYETLIKQLNSLGAVAPNVLSLLRKDMPHEYFFRRDHHWTPAGARETAKLVAETVKALPVYNDLTKKRFVTEESVLISRLGTMNDGLQYICGNNFGWQYVQGFQTVPAEETDDVDEADLFGGDDAGEVVLVGTSNSALREDEYKNYNFDGFLKEYLSVDIQNFAIPGSGRGGSLLRYLSSTDYDPEHPPSLIIWESPGGRRFDEQNFYRQIIPAIRGGCESGQSAVLEANQKVPPLTPTKRVQILSNFNTDDQAVLESTHFLELKIGDTNVNDFYVIIYFDDGSRDKIHFRKGDALEGGKYYLQMNQDSRGKRIFSVFLEPRVQTNEAVDIGIKLCH